MALHHKLQAPPNKGNGAPKFERDPAIVERYGIGATWDDAAGAPRRLSAQEAKAIFAQDRTFTFDAEEHLSFNGEHKGKPVKWAEGYAFHPGRDLVWGGGPQGLQRSAVYDEFRRLESMGVPLRSHRHDSPGLFAGEAGFADLEVLDDYISGKRKLGGGATVYDAAPNLFLANELVLATNEIVREDHVPITARDVLPFVDKNTFLQQYRFDRIAQVGPGYSTPLNMSATSSIAVPVQAHRRESVFRMLYHHASGAVYNEFEIQAYAEARANGAPDIQFIRDFLAMAREDLLRTENALAYFGHPDLLVAPQAQKLQGLFNNDEIDQVPAGANFGTDTETDRQLLVGPARKRFNETNGRMQFDTLLVSVDVWTYINDAIFKSDNADSTETVFEVAMKSLRQFGVNTVMWIPEAGFDADQETSLKDHGFSDALAQAWAGGLNGESVMAFINRSRDNGYVCRGKDVFQLPQERYWGNVSTMMAMSSGGFDVRKPKAYEIRTGATTPPIP